MRSSSGTCDEAAREAGELSRGISKKLASRVPRGGCAPRNPQRGAKALGGRAESECVAHGERCWSASFMGGGGGPSAAPTATGCLQVAGQLLAFLRANDLLVSGALVLVPAGARPVGAADPLHPHIRSARSEDVNGRHIAGAAVLGSAVLLLTSVGRAQASLSWAAPGECPSGQDVGRRVAELLGYALDEHETVADFAAEVSASSDGLWHLDLRMSRDGQVDVRVGRGVVVLHGDGRGGYSGPSAELRNRAGGLRDSTVSRRLNLPVRDFGC